MGIHPLQELPGSCHPYEQRLPKHGAQRRN